MATKNKSADEMRMAFLEEEFVYEAIAKGIRVKKMLLKGGFGDWLLVITAKTDEGASVAFVGAGSIRGVARKLHEQFSAETLAWKEDRYAD